MTDDTKPPAPYDVAPVPVAPFVAIRLMWSV